MDLWGKYDNLIVSRTFSKWCALVFAPVLFSDHARAGLAGLRLGYCAAHEELVRVMMAIKQPYNVNTAAEAAGLAALEHRDLIMSTVTALRKAKDDMFAELEKVCWGRGLHLVLSHMSGAVFMAHTCAYTSQLHPHPRGWRCCSRCLQRTNICASLPSLSVCISHFTHCPGSEASRYHHPFLRQPGWRPPQLHPHLRWKARAHGCRRLRAQGLALLDV